MLPTISIAGDSVLISKRYRRGRGIAVGDMVSVRHPIMPAEGAIKRVLGLPGDFVGRDSPVGVQEPEMEQGGVGEEEEGRGQRMMIQVCAVGISRNGWRKEGERREKGRANEWIGTRRPLLDHR